MDMVEKVARALAPDAWANMDEYAALKAYDDDDKEHLRKRSVRVASSLRKARAAIEAMPLEQLIRDAYVRGVEWNEENPLDRDYRFKASADYADKTLSAALSNTRESGE